MKYILLIFSIIFCSTSFAQNKITMRTPHGHKVTINGFQGVSYYVSNYGNDANNGTSVTTAWKTIAKVETVANAGTILPGDRILFKRGDQFTGKAIIKSNGGGQAKSGTPTNPIIISSYDSTGVTSSTKPVFMYPQGGSTPAESRVLIWFRALDYWVVDGINITDLVTPSTDHIAPANCGVPIYLGEDGGSTCNHFLFNNIDVSYCGMGFVWIGDFNKATNCNLSKFKNLKSTSHVSPGTQFDDYGANPFTIMGSNNDIISCVIKDGWAESLDFGYNGGAVEMFHTCSNNRVMYCDISDCNGIYEFGSNNGGLSTNNVIAYCKITNCGQLVYYNINSVFAIECGNTMIYNCIIVEQNTVSRYSGSAGGTGLVTPEAIGHFSVDSRLFGYNQTPAAAIAYDIRNSIIQMNTGLGVRDHGGEKTTHQNNIYKLSNGSITVYTISGSELNSSAAIWTNTTAPNAVNWDFNLIDGSPGIDFGQTITGYTTDFAGLSISGITEVGVYEKIALVFIGTDPVRPDLREPKQAFFYYDTYARTIHIKSKRADCFFLFNTGGQLMTKGEILQGKSDISLIKYSAGIYYLKTGQGTYPVNKL